VAVAVPAHSIIFFQALDLLSFGALTKLEAIAGGEFDHGSVNGKIRKLIQLWSCHDVTRRMSLESSSGILFPDFLF
jgi:hypothetical protein